MMERRRIRRRGLDGMRLPGEDATWSRGRAACSGAGVLLLSHVHSWNLYYRILGRTFKNTEIFSFCPQSTRYLLFTQSSLMMIARELPKWKKVYLLAHPPWDRGGFIYCYVCPVTVNKAFYYYRQIQQRFSWTLEQVPQFPSLSREPQMPFDHPGITSSPFLATAVFKYI